MKTLIMMVRLSNKKIPLGESKCKKIGPVKLLEDQ